MTLHQLVFMLYASNKILNKRATKNYFSFMIFGPMNEAVSRLSVATNSIFGQTPAANVKRSEVLM